MTPPINSDETIAEILRDYANRASAIGIPGSIVPNVVKAADALAARRAANTPVDGVVVDPATILAARDALLADNLNEAWHQLYTMADPTFTEMQPWRNLEHKAALSASPALPSQVVEGFDATKRTDQIAMAIATLDGEQWVRLSDHKAAMRSCLTSPAAEPVAWTYELATRISNFSGEPATYHDFEPRVSFEKPNVPEGSIRNLRALAPSASREVTVTDEMVERAAKALVIAKGTNPLCLFEFNVFTGQEPFDHEDTTGRRFIYAWRKQVDNARAALLAALPEREVE